jgi:hypothetical protein
MKLASLPAVTRLLALMKLLFGDLFHQCLSEAVALRGLLGNGFEGIGRVAP